MALVGGKRRQKKETHDKKKQKKHPVITTKNAFIDEVFILSVVMSANLNARMNPLIQITMSGMATALAMHSCVNELARDSTVEWKPQHRKLPEM